VSISVLCVRLTSCGFLFHFEGARGGLLEEEAHVDVDVGLEGGLYAGLRTAKDGREDCLGWLEG